MALNRSDKSRILRRYSPGMTRNSEMSTEPSQVPGILHAGEVSWTQDTILFIGYGLPVFCGSYLMSSPLEDHAAKCLSLVQGPTLAGQSGQIRPFF